MKARKACVVRWSHKLAGSLGEHVILIRHPMNAVPRDETLAGGACVDYTLPDRGPYQILQQVPRHLP